MYRCQWTPALLSMVLLAMQSTASIAETRIGVAASTKPNAQGIVGANSQTLSPGSELYASETVRTGNLGQADLVFVDKTNLTVGPTSEVVLDKFVYDPTGSSGSVVLLATRGAFRFVTGTQDHRAYQVNTPYGSLGVRGTTVEIVLQPKTKRKLQPGDCLAKIRLVEGQGAEYTTFNKKHVNLTHPNEVACLTQSGEVVYSISTASILPPALAQQQGAGAGW
jgi:FecR protein